MERQDEDQIRREVAFQAKCFGFRVSRFLSVFLDTTRNQKRETRNSVPLGSCILPCVTNDPVYRKGLLFTFDADVSDSIEHEAIP